MVVGIPALIAAVLCLIEISVRSISFDEAATVTIAAQHGSALGSAIAHDGGNMSGFYALLHVLIGWFGNAPAVVRLPSALASVATVALTALIGRRLFGRRAGFAAGLLAAVSLPLVFWAQTARGYALMVAFVCGAYLVLVSHRRSGTSWGWLGYVVLMTLAIYSSFVAVLVIPAQLLVLLPQDRRRHLRPFAISLVGIAILSVPLIILATRRGSGQLFWVPRPTQELEIQVLQSLTSAGLEPSFRSTTTTTPLLIATLGLLLLITAMFLPARRRPEWWGVAVTVAWVLTPALLIFLYSFALQPLFLPRNLLMSVPAVALLLGAGIGHRRSPPWLGWLALVVLVAGRAVQLAPSYGVSPEPWRQASSYVLTQARPGDCAVFYPADGRMAFQYYYGRSGVAAGRPPRAILPQVRWGIVQPYVEDYATLDSAQLATQASGCHRLWLISSHEGQIQGPVRSRVNRARFQGLTALLEGAFRRERSRKFGYASAIHVALLSDPRR